MSTAVRVAVALAIVLNLGVSAFYRRRARLMETIPRSREPRVLRLVRLAVGLPMAVVLLLYLVAPRWMAWSEVPVSGVVRAVGAAVALATVALTAWTLRSLGNNVSETVFTKSSHELVTGGPYRWVRHPLYTGGFLLLTGIALASGSVAVAVLALVSIGLLGAVVVPREEAELERRFGEGYARYRRQTGALLPRPGSSAGGSGTGTE